MLIVFSLRRVKVLFANNSFDLTPRKSPIAHLQGEEEMITRLR